MIEVKYKLWLYQADIQKNRHHQKPAIRLTYLKLPSRFWIWAGKSCHHNILWSTCFPIIRSRKKSNVHDPSLYICQIYAKLPNQLFTIGGFNSIWNFKLNSCLETAFSIFDLSHKSAIHWSEICYYNRWFHQPPTWKVFSHVHADFTRTVFSVSVSACLRVGRTTREYSLEINTATIHDIES